MSNGAGQIAGSNVTNVAIVCVANAGAFAVRGVVAGLAGSGLVLRNNGGDDLAIAGDGEFSFATAVATGASYSVSVAAPPANPSQTCSIQNASGVMGGVDVTNVRVICSTNSFSIGGTVGALTGLGLVLVDDGERPGDWRKWGVYVPNPTCQRRPLQRHHRRAAGGADVHRAERRRNRAQ